ncbi:MAG TPA: uracil-DNA glycosylase [Candidatus Limnocylindrales bacterium]
MTDVERRQALEAIAAEVRSCTDCRLHEGRTRAVPGEGDPETEVVFVGEGPGFNEDRLGRPFVGRAGDLLVKLLASIGWRREEVFITNVVKCRPPDNRDPLPDEIAACAKYLHRQLEVLDPAVVVTLGRHSMARFMPGARISQSHGTVRPVDPATGARSALVFAMYHPAAALRTPSIERESYSDMAGVPAALIDARLRRERAAAEAASAATIESVTAVELDAVLVGQPAMAGDFAPAAVEPDVGEAVNQEPRPAIAPPPPSGPAAAEDVTPQLTLF